uniref:Uncharacterized protein n=1 Tax=Parascaris univalens TaxID=6257 RepID=A0A915AKU2_PARUN
MSANGSGGRAGVPAWPAGGSACPAGDSVSGIFGNSGGSHAAHGDSECPRFGSATSGEVVPECLDVIPECLPSGSGVAGS